MKWIFFLLATLVLWTAPVLRAQDAATQERMEKLSGDIEKLIEKQGLLQKEIEEMRKDLASVREQANKPTGNYAAQEDLKRLAEAVKEIDHKRLEDYAKIQAALKDIAKGLSSTPPSRSHTPPPTAPPADGGGPENGKGYEYIIHSGDTLSIIAQAYREKNIKVTAEKILKANPGLNPDKLRIGQKIWIPAPQP